MEVKKYLNSPSGLKEALALIPHLDENQRLSLLESLEAALTSSSWTNRKLFKPGIRNLYLQEKIQARQMFNKFVIFLGDQYYLFKFFFQNLVARGELPTVVGFLKQSINNPRFRFRCEAVESLVELAGCDALPSLVNTYNSLDSRRDDVASLLDVFERIFDQLEDCASKDPKHANYFKILRLAVLDLENKSRTYK